MRVLLVEDDDDSRFMMMEVLEHLGVEAEEYPDAKSFIRRVSDGPCDFELVLLDIHMPKMSGDAALKKLVNRKSAKDAEVPVIAVTADPAWHDLKRAQAAGFDGFIAKPISIDAIRQLIV